MCRPAGQQFDTKPGNDIVFPNLNSSAPSEATRLVDPRTCDDLVLPRQSGRLGLGGCHDFASPFAARLFGGHPRCHCTFVFNEPSSRPLEPRPVSPSFGGQRSTFARRKTYRIHHNDARSPWAALWTTLDRGYCNAEFSPPGR